MAKKQAKKTATKAVKAPVKQAKKGSGKPKLATKPAKTITADDAIKLTKEQKQFLKHLEQLFKINHLVHDLEIQHFDSIQKKDNKDYKLFEKRINALDKLSEKVLDLELLLAGE